MHAQFLENRVHMMVKADASVANPTRLFLAAKSLQRVEQERREQEASSREDARKKELDALYRLAKENTAAKRASAGEAREETRRMVMELDAQRKEHKERT